MKRIMLLAFIVLITVPVYADDDKTALAIKLFEIMHYPEHFKQQFDTCQARKNILSPETLYSKDQKNFGKINPEHELWPELIKLHNEYIIAACSHYAPDIYTKVMAEAYAQNLSATELKDTIAFYQSATGQHVVSAADAATDAMINLGTEITNKLIAEDAYSYRQKVSALMKRAK